MNKQLNLKKLLFFFSFSTFFLQVCGQDKTIIKNDKPLSINIVSPFFYRDYSGYYEDFIVYCNLEYSFPYRNYHRWSVSAGTGQELLKKDFTLYPDFVVFSAVNWIYGTNIHFLEVGTGLGWASAEFLIQFRVGYRLEIGRRGLFRVGYNPYLWLKQHNDSPVYPFFTGSHNISVSLGYRFNIGKKK